MTTNLHDLAATAISLSVAPILFAAIGIYASLPAMAVVPFAVFSCAMLLLAAWCRREIGVRNAVVAESEGESGR